MTDPQSLRYSLAQVKDSHLLTPERLAEVAQEMLKRRHKFVIADPTQIKKDDRPVVKNAVAAELSPGAYHMFYTREGNEWDQEHLDRCLLHAVLTPEEIALLEKHCLDASSSKREADLFYHAEKIKDADWKEGVFYGDDYYASISDLMDMLWDEDDEGIIYPEYVWAAETIQILGTLDASEILTNLEEGHMLDDYEPSYEGEEEFTAAVEKFKAQNKDVVYYVPNYKKAILIDMPAKTMEVPNE